MYWPKFQRNLFPGQQPDEEIYMVLRQHWMMFFLKFLAWMLFAAILMFLDLAIDTYFPVLNTAPYAQVVNLVKSVYLMFLMLGLLMVWIMYYLNMEIITNERIVDVTQTSLIHHTVSELHLSRIEDVTAEVQGVFGTFLDYGNIYIQTAGETERFTFQKVPNPGQVEKLILDLYERLPQDERIHKASLKK